jgi:hypothetical protein
MAWQEVGTINLDGSLQSVPVGAVPIPSSGGLEIRVQQLTPADEALFRAGLLYVRTTNGRTLGSTKFWGHAEGEDYPLGTLLTSEETTGTLYCEPRWLNLKSLKGGRTWTLKFWVQPLEANVQAREAARSFASTAGAGLNLIQVSFP